MASDAKVLLEEIGRAVKDDEIDLTSWEDGFIQSIKAYVDFGIALTDKQDAVLERIWRRATGRSE